jgi:hypothetical protein
MIEIVMSSHNAPKYDDDTTVGEPHTEIASKLRWRVQEEEWEQCQCQRAEHNENLE